MPAAIRALLTDIEGTTTPIAFVRDTLFPYARARLETFLAEHASNPEVQAALAETRHAAPGQAPLDTLLAWMDADAKATPLKTLQGLIWNEGYTRGDIKGALYPDVAPALRLLHASGITLHVYSSGSIHAQRLLFAHTTEGDLTPLFSSFFDTTSGGKREAASYRAIAASIALPPDSILFASDFEGELDAAESAGLAVCQLVREEDYTIPRARGDLAADFAALVDVVRKIRE